MEDKNLADEMNSYDKTMAKWVELIRVSKMTAKEIREALGPSSALFKACVKAELVAPEKSEGETKNK